MTIPINQVTAADLAEARRQRMVEIEQGGDLTDLPCPYCNLPRCDRSDYIRCSACGMNWPKGYDASKAPAVAWAAKEEAEKMARKE